MPTGLKLGNPTGICIDTNQHLVVFQRAGRDWPLFGSMPDEPIKSKTIFVIDIKTGKLINSWGYNSFIMPHGLKVDQENNIWVTDVGLQQVFKFRNEGKLLMKLGKATIAGNDSLHFDQPTDIVIANGGSFYVSDGNGNSRIIKFSATGKYLFEWGKKGDKEGEFNTPHGIYLGQNGHVYVADRGNNRVQVFKPNGQYITQFTDDKLGSVCAITFDKTRSTLFAVDDLTFLKIKHFGSDVIIFDSTKSVKTRFGRSGSYQGKTAWYHALTVDKDENVYVGDILENTISKV